MIVEHEDHQPLVVISPARRSGRPIVDILREARQRNSTVTLDPDFGADLDEVIAQNQRPWNPPSWD